MQIKVHFPAVGSGDCIIAIKTDDDGTKQSLMVDCGIFNDEVKKIVVEEAEKKIDCLVVTHYDSDHIQGIIRMLKDLPDLEIKKILYNSYPTIQTENAATNEKNKERLAKALNRLHCYEPPKAERAISTKQAVSLTALILGKEQWKEAWVNRNIISDEDNDIDLDGLGHLFIISPTKNKLDELTAKYKSEFAALFMQKVDTNLPSLFEILMRLSDAKNKYEDSNGKEQEIASFILSEATIKNAAKKRSPIDDSIFNAASIAFVWEIDNHRFLFTGDALPDVLEEGLNKYMTAKGIATNGTLFFDIIKVPHHGSECNTTSSLLEKIDSGNFMFCGKNGKKAPAIMTVAKIICRDLPAGIDPNEGRNLYFNLTDYSNTEMEAFFNFSEKPHTLSKYKIKQELTITISQIGNEGI